MNIDTRFKLKEIVHTMEDRKDHVITRIEAVEHSGGIQFWYKLDDNRRDWEEKEVYKKGETA